MNEAPFALYGGLDEEADLLGLWQQPDDAVVAFDSNSPPVWRANLPADPQAADVQLARGEAQLARAELALASADLRLERFIEAQQSGSVAFGSAAPAPEQELASWLEEINDDIVVGYGIGEAVSARWEQAARALAERLEQLQRAAFHFAWVESAQADQLIARTGVGWTGDVRTLWATPPTLVGSALHRRTLALALASRHTTLRVVFMALEAAPKLAALLTGPGGALIALPAAWKFLRGLLAEIQRHESTTSDL